jgi:hypothetical protein
VVGVAVAAGDAAAAPDHLLDGDHVTRLEEGHFLADLDHLAGELMTEDGRKLGQPRVEDVVVVIRLIKVHVRTTDAARLDLQENFFRPRLRVRPVANLEGGVVPDGVPSDSFPGLLFPL